MPTVLSHPAVPIAIGLGLGRKVNVNQVVNHTRTPTEARNAYRAWIQTLIDHYTVLIQEKGDDLDDLLRLGYCSRGNNLLFTNLLNNIEKRLNQALTISLASENSEVGKTISLIEQQVQLMRREEAERIFQ